jgi:hypothetical protein
MMDYQITGTYQPHPTTGFATECSADMEYLYARDGAAVTYYHHEKQHHFCAYCGTRVLDDDRACVSCGAPVREAYE